MTILKYKRRSGYVSTLLKGLVLGTIAPALLVSQSFYGSVRGDVRDQNGGAVPNIRVTLLNDSTGTIRTSLTTSAGEYVFNDIVPATYSVSTEAPGFKKFNQKNVIVGTQQQITLDLNLELGQVTETVEVTTEVPLVETSNASQGQVLDNQKLADLPNIGRNPFIMAKLALNVIPTGNPVFNRMEDQSGSASVSIAGGTAHNYIIDGVPIGDSSNRAIIIPSIEAVQEVKIQSNTYDAEIGRTGGGMFNTTLKSGGNQYHASLFGSTRQTSWDANGFFNNAAGISLPPQPNYTWGGSLGGRVKIPKIYDGRNKTFFFLAHEGYNDTQSVSKSAYTPTAPERLGDFSQTKFSTGALQVIYDPLTTVQNASGTYTRTAFPNNVIPAGMLSPVGVNIAKTLAAPQTAPAYYGSVDATAAASITSHARQYVGKLDQDVFPWWRATLSYMRYYSKSPGASYFGGISAPEQWTLLRRVDATAVNNLFSVSPSTVLTVRYGFNRFPNYCYNATQGFDATVLGFPASFAQQQQFPTFPVLFFSNIYPADSQGVLGTNQKYVYDFVSKNLSVGLSKSMGHHSFKSGFDYRRIVVTGNSFADSSGSFTFNGVFTQSSPTSPIRGTGADLADFLLGYPSSGDGLLTIKLTDYTDYLAGYLQDDIRVSRKLTINLGLRWEREYGIKERNNGLVTNFDEAALNPLAANVTGIRPTGIVQFAGVDGQPTSIGNPDLNKFGPRAGAAWQVTRKTVVRGGYGLFFAPQFSLGSPVATPGYSSTTTYIASSNGNATPAGSLNNPFPNGLTPPVGNAQGPLTAIGQSVSVTDPKRAGSARVHQYSFDIQRELPGGIALMVGYVGSHSTHTGLTTSLNSLDLSLFSLRTALNQAVPNPFYGHGGTGILANPTVTQQQLLLPHPTFGSVSFTGTAIGWSTYHSIVAKAQKRLSKGLTFLTGFTWMENTDVATGQDPHDFNDVSLGSNDVPRRWTTAVTYELPFGRGRTLINSNRALDYLVGGWSFNATSIYQAGAALSISQNQNTNPSGYGQRPNATGVDPATTGSLEERLNNFINPAAFSVTPQFSFGNLARRIRLYGPGLVNWDMSLFKSVTFRDRYKVQFRFEGLNATNTPLFASPGTSLGSASFGKITSQTNLARQLQMALRLTF
jgi:hypothetical protein